MKIKQIMIASSLMIALSTTAANAGIAEGFTSAGSGFAGNISTTATNADIAEGFTSAGNGYAGYIDLIAQVPVSIPGYSSGSFFFFESGEGTGDGISVSGATGRFPILTTYYMPYTVTQISLYDEPASPSNSVPLPPALLLIGSGLAGLLGLRSRLQSDISVG